MNYHYSENIIQGIFNSEKFINDTNNYKNNNKEMIHTFENFITSLQLNDKYYRLELSKKKSKKYFADDTICIKEINGYLNKLTESNYDKLYLKIKKSLDDKQHLHNLILKNILDKAVIHYFLSHIYIRLINDINLNDSNNISNIINEIYNDINNSEPLEKDDYSLMCHRNKKIDKLIGYYILSVELEKSNIIFNIETNIISLIENLKTVDNNDDKYKFVMCLYNILKSYYNDKYLLKNHSDLINELISNEKSNKIKFRLMDIIDRK